MRDQIIYQILGCVTLQSNWYRSMLHPSAPLQTPTTSEIRSKMRRRDPTSAGCVLRSFASSLALQALQRVPLCFISWPRQSKGTQGTLYKRGSLSSQSRRRRPISRATPVREGSGDDDASACRVYTPPVLQSTPRNARLVVVQGPLTRRLRLNARKGIAAQCRRSLIESGARSEDTTRNRREAPPNNRASAERACRRRRRTRELVLMARAPPVRAGQTPWRRCAGVRPNGDRA